MRHGHGRTRQALRRFRLGCGPLQRRTDRLEFAGRLLMTLLLLVSVLLSVAIGLASASGSRARAAAEAAERHTVPGTVTADAPPRSDAENPAPVKATVSYRTQAGPRRGVTLVPPGTREGTGLTVWVDRRGGITSPPLDPTSITAQATGIGLATFCGLITLVAVTYRTFRWVLDRIRLRQWAAEWAAVEPRWTGAARQPYRQETTARRLPARLRRRRARPRSTFTCSGRCRAVAAGRASAHVARGQVGRDRRGGGRHVRAHRTGHPTTGAVRR